jgi:PKD repeat protein
MKRLTTRNILQLSAIVLFFIALSSCSKDEDQPDYYINTPLAGFTYTGNDGPAPVTIQFTNTSENADAFEWTFGDGYTSNDREPSHTYYNTTNEVKTYLVVLKAIDSSSGLFQRQSKSIAVQPGN